jgi:hypothetical protein
MAIAEEITVRQISLDQRNLLDAQDTLLIAIESTT